LGANLHEWFVWIELRLHKEVHLLVENPPLQGLALIPKVS
jgi:hypothetical protein